MEMRLDLIIRTCKVFFIISAKEVVFSVTAITACTFHQLTCR